MKNKCVIGYLCCVILFVYAGCGTSIQYFQRDVGVKQAGKEDPVKIKSILTKGSPSAIFDSLIKAGFKFEIPDEYTKAYLAVPDEKSQGNWAFTGRGCKEGPVAGHYCAALALYRIGAANSPKEGPLVELKRSDGSSVPITRDRLLRMMFGTFRGVSTPPYVQGPRFVGELFGMSVTIHPKFMLNGKEDDFWKDTKQVDAQFGAALGGFSLPKSGPEVSARINSLKEDLACRLGSYSELYIDEDEKVDGIAVWPLEEAEVTLDWDWSGPGRFNITGSGTLAIKIAGSEGGSLNKNNLMQRKHMVSTKFVKYDVQSAPSATKTCP